MDGVLLIGEHGDYPWNEKEQHLYPRKYFMEAICGVMSTSGRAVPVSFQWKNPDFLLRNPQFLLKIVDFTIK